MKISREKEAISAYLKLLQNKGAASGLLYRHSLFLDKFTVYLTDQPLERSAYSAALQALIQANPDDDEQASLNIAREFFPFWTQDIKAIAAFDAHYGFDVQCIKWKPLATSLKALIDSLEKVELEDNEAYPVFAYQLALQHQGAEQAVIETRVKLAKALVLRLRDAPVKNNKTYRTAVDFTLPLFTMPENKHLFLVVVREFYNFWAGNADAEAKVLKNNSVDILR